MFQLDNSKYKVALLLKISPFREITPPQTPTHTHTHTHTQTHIHKIVLVRLNA